MVKNIRKNIKKMVKKKAVKLVNTSSVKSNIESKKIKGIHGWLIVLLVGFVLESLYYLLSIGSGVFLGIVNVLVFLLDILMFTLIVLVLHSFFKERKIAINLAIFVMWLVALYEISLIYLSFGVVQGFFLGISPYIIWPVIWTIYLLRSVRVKNTLVKN